MTELVSNSLLIRSNHNLLSILLEDFQCAFIIDVNTGDFQILKDHRDSHLETKEYTWIEHKNHVFSDIYVEDKHLVEELTLSKLREYSNHKTTLFPFEIRYHGTELLYDWVEVNARILNDGTSKLLITTKNTNEQHMIQRIVDLYVLKNLDYFVLINVVNNSYTMFSGNTNYPIPAQRRDDYEKEVIEYNSKYVVPEELENTNQMMMIKNIVKKLEQYEEYEFTSGFFDFDGEYHRSRLQFNYYDKAAGLVVLTRTDITQIYFDEVQKNRELATAMRAAKHDAMTNLYNSKAVAELIKDAFLRQFRSQAVLFFIDLDNFKLVNDTLGHQSGDKVIVHLANKLIHLASKDGIAGRIGGDEFVLFLPISNTLKEAAGYAQEICNALQDCAILQGEKIPVSCSVGIAVYPSDGILYDDLLLKADQALYNAKRFGKNCFSFYSSSAMEIHK